MRCINSECNYPKTSVINSRSECGGRFHRRRHQCHKCNTRYTTYESILYDRDTVEKELEKAAAKDPLMAKRARLAETLKKLRKD